MKDIKGFENLYAITSCGRVWSYPRTGTKGGWKIAQEQDGYWCVMLFKNGKGYKKWIHRLIAEAYIPNPNGFPQVGHSDDNSSHNWFNNLYWTNDLENNGRLKHRERVSASLKGNQRRAKPVLCITLNRRFESAKQAHNELGVDASGICKCCKGLQKSAGGYRWEYC